MVITKLVETNLQDAVKRFSGAEVPHNIHGKDLLNYAKTQGLIPKPQRGTDCLYYLIYWYMSNLRDTSHHVFTSFPLPTLLLFVSTANHILDEIDHLTKGEEIYNAKVIVRPVPENKLEVNIENVTIDSMPVEIQTLEIHLSAPDKSIRTIPLTSDKDKWRTEFSTYGYPSGTYLVDFTGYSYGGKKFIITGSTIAVLPTDYVLNPDI